MKPSASLTYFTPDEVLTKIGFHRYQYFLVVAGGLAYASYNVQLLLQSLISESMWREWPHLRGTMTYSWIFFATGCSKLIGASVLVPLQDIFGRRIVLWYSLAALSIFAAVSSAMPNFESYCVVRCLVYFVSSCVNCSTYVYQLEMVPLRSRTLPPTLTQLFGTTGIVFITMVWWVIPVERGWRYIIALSLVPPLISFAILMLVPLETPRFYCANGKEAQAWEVFGRLTPGGADGLTQLLGKKPQDRALRLEGGDLVAERPQLQQKYTHCGFARVLIINISLGFRKMWRLCTLRESSTTVWIICSLWSLQALGYWGITSYLPSFFESIGLHPQHSTMFTFVCEYPGIILAFLMMRMPPPLGRVNTLRFYALGCALVLIFLTVAIKYLPHGHGALYVPTMLIYFFAAPIWSILYTYTPELFSTDCRGTGMSIAGLANGLPTLVTFFLGAQTVGSWVYPAVWAIVFGVFFGISVWMVRVETVTKPLDDVCRTPPTADYSDELDESLSSMSAIIELDSTKLQPSNEYFNG
eukprot:Gregarina_sp_Poly_1__182@NODE_1041_length_5267_cov_150_372308_g721_i0_p1_GENE_NODE_1041_length_5267_cov_150_372308_g721_i0NODE_1041_length_5267_cov_150_372308_g721_i0_p1_ORF_typecomplete_len527_score29_36Sugar_tr/PF00083_24/4_4e50MFS_1/PF07690_16/3e20MFS_1/PF07690_16/3_6e05TRI12/PF06609_13/2_5e08TRI12/PF06609_13/1_1e03TRI12/PF06609_13/1_7e02MFS_2/PF13347_6/41MFS_2/PF13347_6/1_8e02MFS_2/PF13347_6/5e06MFS_2/PF13347_6/95MFS_3/PF05977_13/0_19MFS_3/PF05977_13/0_0021DUF4191/PF13829_6/16DUF4191/PF13829